MEYIIASFVLMSGVVFMAPKKVAGAKKFPDTKKKSTKPAIAPVTTMPGKADSANLMNQLKAARARVSTGTSKDPEEDKNKVAVLAKYEKLSLRDPKKQEILAKWLGDKSSSWYGVWAQTEFTTTSSSSEQFDGFGTKLYPYFF